MHCGTIYIKIWCIGLLIISVSPFQSVTRYDLPQQVPFQKEINHCQNNEQLPPPVIQNSSSTFYDDTPTTSTRLTSRVGKHQQFFDPECHSPITNRNWKSSRVENWPQNDYVNQGSKSG